MTGTPKPLLDFLSLFGEEYSNLVGEGEALVTRRGIYDVQISSGRIFARVEGETGGFVSVECAFPVLPEKKIVRLVNKIAGSALLFAHVLEGEWCPELELLISQEDCWILPISRKEVQFTLAGKARKELDASSVALLLSATERFSNDPLQVFLLVGQGREELIARIRHARRLLAHQNMEMRILENLDLAPEILFDEKKFYEFDPQSLENEYQLKADELPAAILRRVDPPPLLGLETSFEPELQEVYNRVTTRAQAYAIQLAKERAANETLSSN